MIWSERQIRRLERTYLRCISERDPETYNNANINCLHHERFGQRHKEQRTWTVVLFQSTPNKQKNKLKK